MSWGTDFKADIYISRKLFRSKEDIMSYIDDIKEQIARVEKQLTILISGNPKDLLESPDENDRMQIYWEIDNTTRELYEELHSSHIELFKAELLLNTVEEGDYTFDKEDSLMSPEIMQEKFKELGGNNESKVL